VVSSIGTAAMIKGGFGGVSRRYRMDLGGGGRGGDCKPVMGPVSGFSVKCLRGGANGRVDDNVTGSGLWKGKLQPKKLNLI